MVQHVYLMAVRAAQGDGFLSVKEKLHAVIEALDLLHRHTMKEFPHYSPRALSADILT